MRDHRLLFAAAAAALMAASAPAAAVDLPCSVAKLIVPWAAGGDTDIINRAIAEAVNKSGAKPQLQVVNVPGQGGNKGAKDAKGEKPDGCTLLALHESAIINYIVKRVDFHWDAFEPIALMSYTPSIVGISKQAPFNDVKEMIEYAKKAPNTITTGVTLASTSQFEFLLIEDAMGIKLKYVPYEGTRERITALLANNIMMAEMNIITAKEYLADKSLKALGILTDKRDPILPDLPTFKEQGCDVVYGVSRGILAPKGTSPEIIAHWNEAFAKASKDPAFLKILESQGTEVRYLDPMGYRAYLTERFERHQKAAANLGLGK
jgi:tripartite-type tricarboxylate transporter receptor subunit TctC